MNYGFGPINAQAAFLANDFVLPNDYKEAIELINKREYLTATSLNIREIGQYETSELISGQTWFNTNFSRNAYGQSPQVRYGYRRVFDLVAMNNGPIPVGTTTMRVAPKIETMVFPTNGFGAATIAGPQYVFFPSADISFSFDNSNPEMQTLTINNGLAVVLEQCYITIEYLKQG